MYLLQQLFSKLSQVARFPLPIFTRLFKHSQQSKSFYTVNFVYKEANLFIKQDIYLY